jgi:beta-hydroxylase
MPPLPLAGDAAVRAFPQLASLEPNHDAIKTELLTVLEGSTRIPSLVELHPRDKRISSPQWKNFVLKLWGTEIPSNTRRCPRTTEIVCGLSGVHSALFSILTPGASIPPHRGWAAGVVRCHYPLVTPRDHEQCAITVDGTRHAWREGEPFVFDDTRRHSVSNATDDVRVVLIVDFEPPFRWARKAYSRFRYHAIRYSTEIREICKRAAAFGDIPV